MRCTALILALLAAPSLSAQTTELQPGARIRLTAPGIVAGRFVGTVLERRGDTLRVGAPNTAPLSVPVNSITSLELSRGSSRADGAIRGMWWGGGIGVVFGALIAAAPDNSSSYYKEPSRAEYFVAATVSGLLYGAGIGALVGRERWESFDLRSHTSFVLRDGRPGLAMKLAF